MRLTQLTLLVLLLCTAIHAQTVNSGSTGADGAFNPPGQVPDGTNVQGDCTQAPGCLVSVPLREPPNHVFNFTIVTIGTFVTVNFKPNKANTPVFILAQGDVTINGTIDVSGQKGVPGFFAAKGGPGGFSGGMGTVPGDPTHVAGAGNGPGGGRGGFASADLSTFEPAKGGRFDYGTPELQPLIGGSGGGGGPLFDKNKVLSGANGSGGGGALLIASSTVIDLGSGNSTAIQANGGSAHIGVLVSPVEDGGGGSGGAIRLVATVLRGSRPITALNLDQRGGPGRIRLEAAQANQYTGLTGPQATFNPPGQPITMFPPITPILRIVSIGGVPLPAQPTAEAVTADVTVPEAAFLNGCGALSQCPLNIVVEATHVPMGTQVQLLVSPQFGSGDRITPFPTVTLIGGLVPCMTMPTQQCRRDSNFVNLPRTSVGIISAVILGPIVPEP